MDKPRHPQVIRPWKIQDARKNKGSTRPVPEFRREHEKHPHAPRQG
jgi:hypothetical protein